jgi:beta-N-acetylhexosaminidase
MALHTLAPARWVKHRGAFLLVGVLALAGCVSAAVPEAGTGMGPTSLTEGVDSGGETDTAQITDGVERDVDAEVAQIMATMTVEEKVASLFVVFYPGVDGDDFAKFYSRFPVSGFLLLRSNLPGPFEDDRDFVTQLAELSDIPLLLAVDQEGGPIRRIREDNLPGHSELGAGQPRDTREVFRSRNQLVSQLGATVNFGIVADVSGGPDAYIDNRSFGTDFSLVAGHVTEAVAGGVPGVAQALKHFPGHGMTQEDTHVVIPRVTMSKDEWLASHARPFRAGIAAGVEMVMLSHVVVQPIDSAPASLSKTWVSVLRDEWGFEGVIVTDDLAMLQVSGESEYEDAQATAVAALNAGADLIIHTDFGPPDQEISRYDDLIPGVVEAVAQGDIGRDVIDRAVQRVLTLRLLLGSVSGSVDNPHPGQFQR